MTKAHGRVLLAALFALVLSVSAALYAAATLLGGTRDGARPPGAAPHGTAAPASTGRWVSSWAAAPSGPEPGTATTGTAGRSVRNVVHTGIGGTSARITLSNLYGTRPLVISHATVAEAAGSATAAADPATLRPVTFHGAARVVIPAGQQAVSDPAPLPVPPDTDMLVTTYSPTSSGPVTYHRDARQTSYLADGDRTADTTAAAYTRTTDHWRYLTALDVLSGGADGTVVVLGDSITDGLTATPDTNRRWTDVLARRLRTSTGADGRAHRYGVANEGVSGNRVLTDGPGHPPDNPSALTRFDRDVLGRSNARAVVIVLGVNDLLRASPPPAPETVLSGLRTLVRRAHARGLRAVGATIMPFGGHADYTGPREEARLRINAAIRAGGVFDAVVDFDRALRDPDDPHRLLPAYDHGDHLHPSDSGYRRMGEVFDPAVLRGRAPAAL
ncbi:SGNH/GDSL hydrolase family protein [Streptomyces sp. MS06]|uniref:SGNH/GDSL hydrolase family protein n=1 Tax=Streptomyces sp. MS06 TaxID=3385974 RepID=UPI0039A114A5